MADHQKKTMLSCLPYTEGVVTVAVVDADVEGAPNVVAADDSIAAALQTTVSCKII
jgi:hypothetical protein